MISPYIFVRLPKEIQMKAIGEKKKCSKCKADKNIDEFDLNKTTSDGRQPHCRECRSKHRQSKREEKGFYY